ncbi:hypothetical protein AAFH68_04030 [Flavobacterium sp. CGRL1]
MKTLAIIGSGDLGRQLAYYALSDLHYSSVVFFDDFSEEKIVNGIPIIGRTEDVEKAFELKQFDELLIGIGYKHLAEKKKNIRKISDKNPFWQNYTFNGFDRFNSNNRKRYSNLSWLYR